MRWIVDHAPPHRVVLEELGAVAVVANLRHETIEEQFGHGAGGAWIEVGLRYTALLRWIERVVNGRCGLLVAFEHSQDHDRATVAVRP
jgi:hypothetical protein